MPASFVLTLYIMLRRITTGINSPKENFTNANQYSNIMGFFPCSLLDPKLVVYQCFVLITSKNGQIATQHEGEREKKQECSSKHIVLSPATRWSTLPFVIRPSQLNAIHFFAM